MFWRGMPTVQNLPDSFTNLTASHYSFGFRGQLLSAAWRCGIFGRGPPAGVPGGRRETGETGRGRGSSAPQSWLSPGDAGDGENRQYQAHGVWKPDQKSPPHLGARKVWGCSDPSHDKGVAHASVVNPIGVVTAGMHACYPAIHEPGGRNIGGSPYQGDMLQVA